MSEIIPSEGSEQGPELVGRKKEKDTIVSALQSAAEGKGSMILLQGEAGIGKTHLIRECSSEARNRGFSVMWCKCLHYRNTPYLPFIDMLRDQFGVSILEDYETNLERVRKGLSNNSMINKGVFNDFSDIFIPKDEPVGGYRLREDRKDTLMDFLKENGYRILIITDEDTEYGSNPSVEIIRLGQEKEGVIPPARLERIARSMMRSFARFRHLAVINGSVDLLLRNNPEDKVLNFLSVMDEMALKNSGMVVHLDRDNSMALSGLRDMAVHLKKNDLRNDGASSGQRISNMSVNDLLSTYISEETARKPQLLVIEDLQWADKPSLNLLQYLARTVSDERLVILGSYRPEEYSLEDDDPNTVPLRDALQRISRERLFKTLELPRLDNEGQAEMARSITDQDLNEETLVKMARETEGNPLLITHFLSELEKTRSKLDGDTPAQVETDTITRRLQNLDRRTLDMLELASVLGLECSLEMIVTGLEMDEEEALDRLDSLLEIRLVQEIDEGLRFEHPKARSLIYESIPEERVVALHSIAARLTESFPEFKGESKVRALAGHYRRSGDHSRAYRAFIETAEEFRERMNEKEALKALESAMECIKHLESSRERDLQMVKALQMMGDVHENCGDTREALIAFKKAVDVAEKGNIPYGQSSSYRRIGDIMLKLFEWDQTVDYYLRSLHVSKKEDDQEEVAKAFRGLGIIYYLKGDYTRSMDCYLKYMDFPKKEKRPINVMALLEVGTIYYEMGDFNQALTYFKLAIKRGEESELKQESALGYTRMAGVLMKLREIDDAKRFAIEGYKMVRDHVSSEVSQRVVLEYIELMLEAGDLQRAEEGVSIIMNIPERELGDRLLKGQKFRTIGLLNSRLRKFDEARSSMDKALEINEKVQVPFQLGLTRLHYGLVLFQQMKVEEAMVMLKDASSTFKSINALYFLNRTSSKLRELTFIKEGMGM